MFWCQIEGICVADLTQCYFPGAVAPNDWASCTIDTIANRLPTCRFLIHRYFAHDTFFIHLTALVSIKAMPATPLLLALNGVQSHFLLGRTMILGIVFQKVFRNAPKHSP
jgi:hypothetical protein